MKIQSYPYGDGGPTAIFPDPATADKTILYRVMALPLAPVAGIDTCDSLYFIANSAYTLYMPTMPTPQCPIIGTSQQKPA
jgi:hypothetical protein